MEAGACSAGWPSTGITAVQSGIDIGSAVVIGAHDRAGSDQGARDPVRYGPCLQSHSGCQPKRELRPRRPNTIQPGLAGTQPSCAVTFFATREQGGKR